MYVGNRTIAVGGLFAALTVAAIRLGSILESNTLFLLVLASYLVGIMYERYRPKSAVLLLAAGILLGAVLTPNIFYVCSYGCMGMYMIVNEWIENQLKIRGSRKHTGNISEDTHESIKIEIDHVIHKKRTHPLVWCVRYILYEVMLAAGFFFFHSMLFPADISVRWMAAMFAAAQLGPILYEAGYQCCLHFWRERIEPGIRKH